MTPDMLPLLAELQKFLCVKMNFKGPIGSVRFDESLTAEEAEHLRSLTVPEKANELILADKSTADDKDVVYGFFGVRRKDGQIPTSQPYRRIYECFFWYIQCPPDGPEVCQKMGQRVIHYLVRYGADKGEVQDIFA